MVQYIPGPAHIYHKASDLCRTKFVPQREALNDTNCSSHLQPHCFQLLQILVTKTPHPSTKPPH